MDSTKAVERLTAIVDNFYRTGIPTIRYRIIKIAARNVPTFVNGDARQMVFGKQLREAASEGNLEKCRRWIWMQASLDSCDEDGDTALTLAASRGHVEIAQLLLERGASRGTALLSATAAGHVEMTRFLIDHGASLETQDKNGNTALTLAVSEGHIQISRLLIQEGASLVAQTKNGHSALTVAAMKGHLDLARLLIQNGASLGTKTKNGYTALTMAAMGGHVEIVRLLMENHVLLDSQDGDGDTALHSAISKGHDQVARMLIQERASLKLQNKNGDTALTLAALKGHVEIARLLIERGAPLNAGDIYGQTALILAASKGDVEIARLLIQQGASLVAQTKNGHTALTVAAMKGHVEIARLLIKGGASLTAQTKNGHTALRAAAITGHVEIVALLIENGASLDSQDTNGDTALHFATSKGHHDVVHMLLEKGAPLEMEDISGQTALVLAAFKGHETITRLLIQTGASLVAQTKNGHTALTVAAMEGHVEIVRLLIENGAPLDSQNVEGDTALHLAVSKGHQEVAQLLVKHGASLTIRNKHGNTALRLAPNINVKRWLEQAAQNQVKYPSRPGLPRNDKQVVGGTNLSQQRLLASVRTTDKSSRGAETSESRGDTEAKSEPTPSQNSPQDKGSFFDQSPPINPRSPPTPQDQRSCEMVINGKTYQLCHSSVFDGRNTVVQGKPIHSEIRTGLVVIKIYQSNTSANDNNEVQTFLKLWNHHEADKAKQFVVQVEDFSDTVVYQSVKCSVLVMELGHKNVKEMVERYDWDTILDRVVPTMKQIAQCLHFLHMDMQMVHGDVKLENVVNFGDDFPKLKLIDFESCRLLNQPMQLECTPEYCPPELAVLLVANGQVKTMAGQTLKAAFAFDVWCFGVLWIKYLMRGRVLKEFTNLEVTEILQCIAKPDFNFEQTLKQLEVPRRMKELIRQCTHRDPRCRPTFEDILRSSGLRGFVTTMVAAAESA